MTLFILVKEDRPAHRSLYHVSHTSQTDNSLSSMKTKIFLSIIIIIIIIYTDKVIKYIVSVDNGHKASVFILSSNYFLFVVDLFRFYGKSK